MKAIIKLKDAFQFEVNNLDETDKENIEFELNSDNYKFVEIHNGSNGYMLPKNEIWFVQFEEEESIKVNISINKESAEELKRSIGEA